MRRESLEYESQPSTRPTWTCVVVFWIGVVVGLGVSIPVGDWVAISIHDRPPDSGWWYLSYGAMGVHVLVVVLVYALYLPRRLSEAEGVFWIGMLAGLTNITSPMLAGAVLSIVASVRAP